jgi:formyltetrahydrofolate synthetase
LSMYDSTREPDWELVSDRRLSETTVFDKLEQWFKSRKGNYIIQWASDKMIIQAIQKKILDFNGNIENIVL